MTDRMKVRFVIQNPTITVLLEYHGCQLAMRWPRGEEGTRHMRTVTGNLDKAIEQGLTEAIILEAADGLDAEIDRLFFDTDEDRPDES